MKNKLGDYLMKIGKAIFDLGQKLRFKPLTEDSGLFKLGKSEEEPDDEYGGYGESMF